jgi:hypothetical protein
MLAFLLALYWGALLLLTAAASRIDRLIAPAMLVFGFMPFTINFTGTLWVDVLLATSWLMCAALAFSARVRGQPMSAPRATLSWLLFLIGAWTRPNALFAAVPLGLYLLYTKGAPRLLQRAVVATLLLAGIWFGNWAISYPVLQAKRTYAIHQIVTFDLGGISHFTRTNHFPLTLSAEEAAKVATMCYTPTSWENYLIYECSFVRDRLSTTGLWGSTALWRAWIAAVVREPIAYLRHRWNHFLYFMTTVNYIFHWGSLDVFGRPHQENFAFLLLRKYIFGAARIGGWFFRPILWFALAGACCFVSRSLPERSQRFVLALALSSLIYLATYLFVGVHSDFRYAYWAVLATGSASIISACEWGARLRRAQRYSRKDLHPPSRP